MKFVRYFLIAVSGVVGVVALVAAKTTQFQGSDAVTVFLIGAFCCLNFFYLIQAPAPGQRPNRIAQMFSLWLQAKEADLKQRATQAGSRDSEASASRPNRN